MGVEESSSFYDVHNPATGELIAKTPQCTASERLAVDFSIRRAPSYWHIYICTYHDTSIIYRYQI